MTPLRQAPYGPDGSLQYRAEVTHKYVGNDRYESVPPEWRPFKAFKATLEVDSWVNTHPAYGPICILKDRFGATYPVRLNTMIEILKVRDVIGGKLTAWWFPCKHGENYSLRLAIEEEIK